MSEIEKPSNLVIPTDRVPVAAYQAIYHRLTRKTEKLQNRYKGTYRLTRNDIENLFYRFDQSISQYQVKAKRAEISLTIDNDETHSYSSFEKFSSINLQTFNARTRFFSVEFDFLIVLPAELEEAEEISQRYKIQIEFNGGIVPSDLIASVPYEFFRFAEEQLKTRIEYTDLAVARHIQALLSEWIESLRFDDVNTLSMKTCDRIREAGFASIFVLLASALIGGIFFEFPEYTNIVTPVRYLLSVILIAALVTAVGGYISSLIGKAVSIITPRTRILLTNGDFNYDKSLVKKRRRAKTAIVFLFSGVVLAFCVSLLANFVSAQIFGGT